MKSVLLLNVLLFTSGCAFRMKSNISDSDFMEASLCKASQIHVRQNLKGAFKGINTQELEHHLSFMRTPLKNGGRVYHISSKNSNSHTIELVINEKGFFLTPRIFSLVATGSFDEKPEAEAVITSVKILK